MTCTDMIRRFHYSLAYFDHLRVLLTGLIIFHHSAVMFGAPGIWYLQQPSVHLSQQTALAFVGALNQVFLLNGLFLLSGYLAPFARPRSLIRSNLLQLGLPLLLYALALGPLTAAMAHHRDAVDLIDIGPFWYLPVLALLSAAYAVWRTLLRPRPLLTALCVAGLALALHLCQPWLPPLPDLHAGSLASACLMFVAGATLAHSRKPARISAARPHAPAWRWWSDAAYAACLLHPPVLTALGLLLTDVHMRHGLRFLLAGSAGIAASFLLARAVLHVPGAKQVL